MVDTKTKTFEIFGSEKKKNRGTKTGIRYIYKD